MSGKRRTLGVATCASLVALVGCQSPEFGPSANSFEQHSAPLVNPEGGEENPPVGSGPLFVNGNQLEDGRGNPVRLTGINWFGFETSNQVVHGLWSRDYKAVLAQVRDLGFNSLRLPWANTILDPDARPASISFYGSDGPMNMDLQGKTSLEVLDLIIAEAGRLGLRVILDNHSRAPDGYMSEALWYTPSFSEERWISDWVTLARRYRDNPVVVGFDLNNEPHDEATWGVGRHATDWNAAAERCGNAILRVNPDALIIIEGVEVAGGRTYWWGGNLSAARETPIRLADPSKLVYSTHEYGPEVYAQPWFSDPSFPENLEALWDDHFGFLMNESLGHVLVGEFGIRDVRTSSQVAITWFQRFMRYMGHSYSWTFWSLNPNSGDTGGILLDDWKHINEAKMDALRPYLAPLIPAR